MKKTLCAMALISVMGLTLCSCSGNTGSETVSGTASAGDTTTATESSSGGKKVTAIAFEAPEAPDTTEESLAYLAERAPLFSKYLEIKRTYPQTFETSITTADGEWISSIYIKDRENIAHYWKKPDGSETATLYSTLVAYMLDYDNKIAYKMDYDGPQMNAIADEDLMAKINIETMQNVGISSYPYEYGGEEYNAEVFEEAAGSTMYLFDKETDELRYILAGSNVTKILTLSNTLTNEEIFKVPDGFTEKDYMTYMQEQLESMQSQQSAQ